MLHRAIVTLEQKLRPHLALSKNRLETLALIVLAMVSARTTLGLLGPRLPRRKAHGYLVKSWFRLGFDQIRQLLGSDPLKAIHPWLRITLNSTRNRGVVWCVR